MNGPSMRALTHGLWERAQPPYHDAMAGSVVPTALPRAGSLIHRKSLIGFRAACEEMWGDAALVVILRWTSA